MVSILKKLEKLKQLNGSYVLVIRIKKRVKIKIGSLGEFEFNRGYYFYSGSAMGKNGLFNRVKRHLTKRVTTNTIMEVIGEKKLKWHIDYLLEVGDVIGIKISEKHENLECKAAGILHSIADELYYKFGSSDCHCISHLYYYRKKPELKIEGFIDLNKIS